jgi:hypothetical protein
LANPSEKSSLELSREPEIVCSVNVQVERGCHQQEIYRNVEHRSPTASNMIGLRTDLSDTTEDAPNTFIYLEDKVYPREPHAYFHCSVHRTPYDGLPAFIRGKVRSRLCLKRIPSCNLSNNSLCFPSSIEIMKSETEGSFD